MMFKTEHTPQPLIAGHCHCGKSECFASNHDSAVMAVPMKLLQLSCYPICVSKPSEHSAENIVYSKLFFPPNVLSTASCQQL